MTDACRLFSGLRKNRPQSQISRISDHLSLRSVACCGKDVTMATDSRVAMMMVLCPLFHTTQCFQVLGQADSIWGRPFGEGGADLQLSGPLYRVLYLTDLALLTLEK